MHLQSSGIFPNQGPLGMGHEALHQASVSSSASGASIAQRAQRMEDEAMLYLSQSSGSASARLGAHGGDAAVHLSHSSNNSSAHAFMQISPPEAVTCGAMPVHSSQHAHCIGQGYSLREQHCSAHLVTMLACVRRSRCAGAPQKGSALQPDSLLGSSYVTAMPWDLSQEHQVAAHAPKLLNEIMTMPKLMPITSVPLGGRPLHGLKSIRCNAKPFAEPSEQASRVISLWLSCSTLVSMKADTEMS